MLTTLRRFVTARRGAVSGFLFVLFYTLLALLPLMRVLTALYLSFV